MTTNERKLRLTLAWIVGYFVVISPVSSMVSRSPILALVNSIFGVGTACIIFIFTEGEE